MVFLFGRDLRKVSRESTLFGRVFATLLITLGVVFALLSILLALYMLKSALGIDVFKISTSVSGRGLLIFMTT